MAGPTLSTSKSANLQHIMSERVGALPSWSHNLGWGYYPIGVLGLVLLILVALLLFNRI